MKETTVQFKNFLKRFYEDIFKTFIILFILALPLILIVNTWRFDPLAYLVAFFVCFSISFVNCFTKKEIHRELRKKEI